MRELIIQTLRESVKRYPELKTYLTDETLMLYWISEFKVGEAPDDELRRKDEHKLERALAKFLEGQKARVLTYMRTHDMKAIQPSFWDNELERLWAELGEDFVGVLLHGVEGGISLLPGSGTGLPIDEDKINMSLVKWGREYKDTWLSKIEETSRQYVEDKITAWSLSGQPLSELIKTMDKDTGGMFTKTRATRIAITETTRLHALGNQKAWEEAGTVSQWRWNTANDELVCPICRPNNGKLFPLSELHSKLPAHVNCRCWSSPVWDEEAELERILGEGGGEGGTENEQAPQFNNVQEIERWAKESYANSINLDGFGDNIDYAKLFNETMYEYSQKYGITIDNIYTIKNQDEYGNILETKKSREGIIENGNIVGWKDKIEIGINRAFFSRFSDLDELNKFLNYQANEGWSLSRNIEDLTIHEWGHILTRENNPTALQKYGLQGISKYASESISETIAESFLKYIRGGTLNQPELDILKEFLKVDL